MEETKDPGKPAVSYINPVVQEPWKQPYYKPTEREGRRKVSEAFDWEGSKGSYSQTGWLQG